MILSRRATFAIAGESSVTPKSPNAPIAYCMAQTVLLEPQAVKRGLGIRRRVKTLEFYDCK